MARQLREQSATGIHHVMLRGINCQIIFEDAEDYRVFIHYHLIRARIYSETRNQPTLLTLPTP